MEFLLIIAALGLGYYFSKSRAEEVAAPSQSQGGAAPSQPKSVITVGGGNVVPSSGGYGPSSIGTDLSLTGQGLGTLGSVGAGGAGGIFGSGVAAAGTDVAKAIPIVGAVVSVATSIIGAITAHHQQALANEGKALNDATPRAVQTFALIVQGVANGEIKTLDQAQGYCSTTINA